MGEKPWPGMSEEVSRVQGPSPDKDRWTWKPRLSTSDPVRHASSTAPSEANASNDASRTAVVDARCDPEEKCFPMIPAGAAATDVIEFPEEETVEA
jgi:hypothetical protein